MKRKPGRNSARRQLVPAKPARPTTPAKLLLADVRELIVQARHGVAQTVNAGMTLLYWHIGRRIRQDILKEERAEYGKEIVHALSGQLSAEFGQGFGRTNLFNMVRFAETFPDIEIVHALRGQLGWTHFRRLSYISFQV